MTFETLSSLLAGVDLTSVVAATVVSFMVGWLYYSPSVAGNHWRKLSKIPSKEMKKYKKSMGKMMVGVLASLLVISTTVSVILNVTGVTSVLEGMALGFALWLGLIATTMAMNYMHGRGSGLYYIDTIYMALVFVITGAVITLL